MKSGPINEDRYADYGAMRFLYGKSSLFGPRAGGVSFRGIGRAIRRRDTTAECLKLDARALAATGIFRGGGGRMLIESDWQADRELVTVEECLVFARATAYTGNGSIRFRYVFEDEFIECEPEIVTRPQTFGGDRVYFLCPECLDVQCEILYRPPFAPDYACRKCHRLTYWSAQDAHKTRWSWTVAARGEFFEPPVIRAAAHQSHELLKQLERRGRRWRGALVLESADVTEC